MRGGASARSRAHRDEDEAELGGEADGAGLLEPDAEGCGRAAHGRHNMTVLDVSASTVLVRVLILVLESSPLFYVFWKARSALGPHQ